MNETTTTDAERSPRVSVTADIDVTPQQLAQLFWNMDSDDQANFYAELHRVSEGKLCIQTAYLVSEIARRQACGDDAACIGFRTLHSHAEPYLEVYVDELAKRGLSLNQEPRT